MKTQKIIPFPTTAHAKAQQATKQPKAKKFDALEKAAKALYNARQRCTNPKNPDFPKYGAKGVKVLITDRGELVEAIGLPPTRHHSLDRIDPSGHYEIGNVRWTTAAVQAANKKASKSNKYLSLGGIVREARRAVAMPEDRIAVARAFSAAIAVYNNLYIERHQADLLLAADLERGVLEATSDRSCLRACEPEPGVFHLPGLSMPHARLRMRGDFWQRALGWETAAERGVIAALRSVPLPANVPGPWVDRFKADLYDEELFGAVWVGQPTAAAVLGGWCEGWMMALAPKIARGAAVYPALIAADTAKHLGSSRYWDEVRHPLLDVPVLFIPDFQVDHGEWGEVDQKDAWVLENLLEHRIRGESKTFVGVQNPNKLPKKLRNLVFGRLEAREMPVPAMHPAASDFPPGEDEWNEQFGDRYPGLDLGCLRESEGYQRLVVPSGFLVTGNP